MRSPLTGVVFAARAHPRLADALLPLLIAATAAYAVSVLLLKRSVLTEKIARRGLHLTREYAVDPLEVLFVDEVMHTTPIIAHGQESLAELSARADLRRQWLYPVMEEPAGLLGVIPRRQLIELDGRGGMLGRRGRAAPGAHRVPRRDAAPSRPALCLRARDDRGRPLARRPQPDRGADHRRGPAPGPPARPPLRASARARAPAPPDLDSAAAEAFADLKYRATISWHDSKEA